MTFFKLTNSKVEGGKNMKKWNEESAPNNNLAKETIADSMLLEKKGTESLPFTEELSDGGERNESIEQQLKKQKPGM